MTWQKISCEEYEERLRELGERPSVYSGFTDMGGEYGAPCIETTWCDATGENPYIKGIRHPRWPDDRESGDREPCEHYVNEDFA